MAADRLAGRIFSVALQSIAVLVGIASAVFFSLRLLPGDPARLVLGDQATEPELAALRSRLELDRPIYVQYAHFLKELPRLDFGESLRHPGVQATSRVLEAMGPTSALAGTAVAIGAVLGIGGAVLAVGPWLGRRRSWIDRIFVGIAALPLVAFAPLVTYFLAARLRIVPLPGDPDAGASGLLFASTLLAFPLAAHVGRIARAALSDLERTPMLAVVRAKGGDEFRVWVVHAVPASLGPIITVIATQLGALLGGAIVLERLFERAGLGTLILEAYSARDFPVLEAAVVAAAALFVIAQAVGEMIHSLTDPRVRA
jgi:peptide/nickel transport system permease protein